MADITSTGSGEAHHIYAKPIGGVSKPPLPTEITILDILEASTAKKGNKTVESYSPELMQALFLMWFSGGTNNPIFLQQLQGNAVGAVGEVENKPINFELLKLKFENQLHAICLKVLDVWSRSIREEAEAMKRKMKSDDYKEWQAHERRLAYDRLQEDIKGDFPRINKLLKIDEGIQQGLSGYLTMIKTSTDPTVNQDLPFITAALIVGGTLRSEYVGVVDTVTTSQILISPVKDANDHAFAQIAPQDQAVALGYIGALILTGASYQALGQTIPGGGADKKILDRTFAENYAKNILNIIDGQGLKTIALALISTSVDPGEELTEERILQLYRDVQVVLLSSALALLYKTETSVREDGKVYGGGISSYEFKAMVDGNDKLLDSDLKRLLAYKIRVLLEGNPDKDKIVASMGAFIDAHKDSSSLLDIGSLLANITWDKGPPEVPV